MSTAVFPGPSRPLPAPSRRTQALPSLSQGRAASSAGDLTIHRITSTHHGRTLLTLGHAAEYLANSRRYSMAKIDHAANVEAVHILMEVSRSVFDDFAECRSLPRRVEDWLVGQAVRLLQ